MSAIFIIAVEMKIYDKNNIMYLVLKMKNMQALQKEKYLIIYVMFWGVVIRNKDATLFSFVIFKCLYVIYNKRIRSPPCSGLISKNKKSDRRK